MKKSLAIAIENARLQSLATPDLVVYVMDKPRKEAVISTSAWVVRERILEGWHTVKRFINGREG